jgi:hypothetical protein
VDVGSGWTTLPIRAALISCPHTGIGVGSDERRCAAAPTPPKEEATMILATTTVEDYDQFEKIFSTQGADKRREHGSKGAQVFRDPNESDRVWVLFDWDADGWQRFVSDPEVPAIMKLAGHKGRPQPAEAGGHYDA